MSERSRYYSIPSKQPEREKIEPGSSAVLMRPHHFFLEFIQQALAGNVPSHLLAQNHMSWTEVKKEGGGDPYGYYTDVVGNTPEQAQAYRRDLTWYLNRLRFLPDDGHVILDIQPDGLCDSCAIRKHCKRTNYRRVS